MKTWAKSYSLGIWVFHMPLMLGFEEVPHISLIEEKNRIFGNKSEESIQKYIICDFFLKPWL